MKLLKDLMEIQGVSGNEHKVRKYILKEIKKHVKDVNVDKFGNIVAHKKGKGAKVLLASHMDEVGLMIKAMNEKGNIYCSEIGGIEPTSLIGQKVHIKTKKGYIHGVVTLPEISDNEEVEEVPKIEDLFVDTGLSEKELKTIGIEIGSFLEMEQKTDFLGGKDVIAGKALDDRVGCCILIELAKQLRKSNADIYYVFTVQEEVGLYGSKTSIHKIDPDWAIVVDVTGADDAKEHAHEATKRLGKGPCITVKDAAMISNICIDEWLKEIAKKKKIPIQIDVSELGTTDALSISFVKGGVPTAVVGVAVRNIHTAIGIASISDIKHAIKLLKELMMNPPKVCIK